MHTYTTLKDGNGFNVLIKDGKEAFCPYVPPLMRQSTYTGQAEMFRLPCNTGCPHATIKNNRIDGEFFYVSCGSESQEFEISQQKEETNHPASIIQM